MQINVRYLENLKIEASFDDFRIIADQPIRYKGDGSAPGPYDYFLASSAMCAAYFVKVYCNARDIPTDDIKITQDNIVDPNNRYQQDLILQIELPATISEKDKDGILKSMERCTVKRVIQNNPGFKISAINKDSQSSKLIYELENEKSKTLIIGKDKSLEDTIIDMTKLIEDLGIKLEIASWRNPIPHVWSVHVRDADSPICFSNGKGATKEAALCSALGEYIERISNNYFYNDYYLGQNIAESEFVHYPNEKWFKIEGDDLPDDLLDKTFLDYFNPDNELKSYHLVDTNSGNINRGICALPYIRQSDMETVYIPVNLIGNIYVSNGMSAGNSKYEARVQCVSEIFERAVKNEILINEISLPDVPQQVLEKYPNILEGINSLKDKGFPVVVKDASLGGKFPVMCVTLLNPRTGGVFASFGSHPNFEVALERSLTELLQGRSFEGLNEMPPPTFNSFSVTEHNNIIDHFIDSTGVVSWKFFSSKSDFEFVEWNFSGSTKDEFDYLMNIFKQLEKEVYIADYEELGASACRILVPNYSEIYKPEDLVWDNNNQAIQFREDILSIHSLSDEKLSNLVETLEETEIDNYTKISELIGIAFDENSVWGQLDIGELKCLSHIALQNFEEAKEYVEMFLTFNDNTVDRKRFYQVINTLLDIEFDEDSCQEEYMNTLKMMYGNELVNLGCQTIKGEVKFPGLTPTDLNLTGQEKHLKLIESYQKLQVAKKSFHSNLLNP